MHLKGAPLPRGSEVVGKLEAEEVIIADAVVGVLFGEVKKGIGVEDELPAGTDPPARLYADDARGAIQVLDAARQNGRSDELSAAL